MLLYKYGTKKEATGLIYLVSDELNINSENSQ